MNAIEVVRIAAKIYITATDVQSKTWRWPERAPTQYGSGMKTRRLCAAFLVAVLAGCLGLGAGSKYYKKGEDAQKQGDLEEAYRQYKSARDAEPNNARYKQAVDDLGKELAAEHRANARAKEKQGDWAAASSEWARASEFAPNEKEYQIRRDLSGLKAKNLGPDEWYEALKGIADKYPNEEVVARSLEGARAQAYQYNVNLAQQFLASGEGARALGYFERARAIDPTTPGLALDAFVRAEALAMAEEAAAKLAQGDAVTAFDLYQKAFEKLPLPEIKRDMAKAKQKASAILTKLETARDRAKKKKYAEALRLYGAILDLDGAPPFVEEEAAQVRHEVIAQMVADAEAKAAKKQIGAAHRVLLDALTYANLGRVERDTYKSAIDHARDGRAKTSLEVLDKAGLDKASPLYVAGRKLAAGAARDQLANAEKLAKKNPEKALEILDEIEAFEAELAGIGELRKQLRSGSFQDLLDEALTEAKKGDGAEAGSLLLAALNSSQAPDNMRDPAQEGCDALKAGRYAAAEKAFDRALAAAPRSKMAQRGIDIARMLRKSGESDALEAIKTGRADQDRAVAVLEDAIAVEPANRNAKEAIKVLMARAKSAGADADAARMIGWAARLSGGAAKQPIEDAAAKLAAGDHAGAESAFAAVKRNELAELGREIAKSRMLASLSSGAKTAATGDESSARSVAKLLEKDPSNKEAQAAVKSMLDKASEHASQHEDDDAAKFLKLATIASNPAPGVKKELDRGNDAIAKGSMSDAEKAYAAALDIDPESKVAKIGWEIARNARVGMLSSAVADAKSSGNAERAAEALKKTLEVDPNSPEAKKAFADLLAEAKRQGEAGNDAQAAALLDAANVVSKPETVRRKIASAIGLIKKSEHDKALAAFDEIAKDGDSQVVLAGKEVAAGRKKSGLAGDAKGLENGTDLQRGAAAVAKLRAVDPADANAKRAIDAALSRAEKSAATGDDRAAAKELAAVAAAIGEEKEAKDAIAKLENSKHQEAEDAFAYSESQVAVAGRKIARGRRMGSLKAGLSGQGEEAAKSIAALLAADPNNKEAKKAFEQLLEDAKRAAKSADDVTAADKIGMACIASNAPESLSSAITAANSHLSASQHAEAEKAYVEALAAAKDSRVAKVGLEIAKQRRLAVEKEAKTAIGKSADPRPHAKVLQASLLVEPQSRTVSQALADLVSRAKKSAKQGSDAETAQVLEAAALLENAASEVQLKLTEASGLYAKGSFEEAETAFASVDGDSKQSKVADLGKELARGRRVSLLESEWKAAKAEKDVVRENGIVGRILAIDPNHREAKAAAKRVEKEVGSSRIGAARSNKEMGKLGVAYVYLARALSLNSGDAEAKREMDDVSEKLKEKLDLILLVEPVARAKDVGGQACLGFDEMLRDEIMTASSKRTDLGGFVLSPNWTKAVEDKSDKAPEVSGSIAVTVTKCKTSPRDGKATFTWSLLVPRKGSPVTQGEVSAELPGGLIPRDEQDEAGNNAKMALAARATASFVESLEGQRDAIELWLLTLAEHAMAEKDVAQTADAYARLTIKQPRSIDPKRVEKIEEYLAKELH
jgi:tetratricopeptide (TPR) repeat protein